MSADELAEFFFFDQRDRELILGRRRERNRLGFAMQLGTVRYLCRFLKDPCAVPEPVVRWVARELALDASAGLEGAGGNRRQSAWPCGARRLPPTRLRRNSRAAKRAYRLSAAAVEAHRRMIQARADRGERN